jgi:hypothetical protein
MSYPLLNVFLTMMWFFLWVLWIFLVVRIVMDIFRSHDLGGWGKAGWLVLVIVLPFLGVFAYLIARGRKMGDHEVQRVQAQDEELRAYGRHTSHGDGSADEVTKLADLRDRGVISDAEFQRGKEKALTTSA